MSDRNDRSDGTGTIHENLQDKRQLRGMPVTSTPADHRGRPLREDSRHGTQASGPRGDNPSTAGPGPTGVRSATPENSPGHLNPSAPEDANATPGSTSEK